MPASCWPAVPCSTTAGTTPVGSLIVFDSEDRAEVDAFSAGDPFTKAGLFQTVTIYPWRKVFFAGARVT